MTRLVARCLLLTLALAGLTGCGDDADEVGSGAEPTATETTLEDCAGLLPESVLDTLGWVGGTPGYAQGRCTLSTDQGVVRVSRVLVPSTPEEALEERCAELEAEDVEWLADAPAQCGVIGDDDLSVSALVARTDDDTVVEARIEPLEVTDPERIEAALVQVVEAAASAL